ncbi:hypothetical protein [Neobacillus sp. PS2-9]|uniref:hypothetical protein n=1 Tax=Neobacillus sp. PS2-9 TaxID=3070676 RepID=UPI0027DEC8D5|nr:hypothetical protein [Neobacillus sp. PS2-9]WML57446.1 hypothetical protein RCG25_21470 [Neobacillus sp. PS2-9]
MRHSFNFPEHIRTSVKDYINSKIKATNPERFNQEPTYTTALLSKLEGVVYSDTDCHIEITTTVFDDRGRNSAESKWGADFAITAKISDRTKTINKAILVQAKKEENDLNSTDLADQIKKMKKLTKSPKVMILNSKGNTRDPYICSGNKIIEGKKFSKDKLADYFTKRVLTTFDGDTRSDFVERVQHSNLNILHISVNKK